MLAKRRQLRLAGEEIERTPLLVPSFSSKGFPEISKIIDTAAEVIDGPILVSAYDLYHKKITAPFYFPSLIFLDSGGYEASKDVDLADTGSIDHIPLEWSREMHEMILSNWSITAPTVMVSYDHPSQRISLDAQIQRAKILMQGRPDTIHEILLKPETQTQNYINVKSILENSSDLRYFDIVGVTEKEIGNSILIRMKNIAKIRMTLDRLGIDIPIHIFGSLDTITTPLYFLAGADIFDGLTWLRFSFHEGYTMYKYNYGAIRLGVDAMTHIVDGRSWSDNYRYLADLQLEMRRFLNGGDFSCFRHHAELFRNAHDSVVEAVGG